MVERVLEALQLRPEWPQKWPRKWSQSEPKVVPVWGNFFGPLGSPAVGWGPTGPLALGV